MRTMEILTICEIASRVLTAIVGALAIWEILSIWEISPQKLTAAVSAKAKRGCNSTWSTSQKTRPASFERPRSSLSNDAGLVS